MDEDRFIVNALVRQALLACQDVLGENGFQVVLQAAGLERFIDPLPPDDLNPAVKAGEYARLNQVIEELYGRAGKGILQRVGRTTFQYSIQEQAFLLGIARTVLKLLPRKQRIKFILTSLVSALKKTNPGVQAWAGEKDGKLVFLDRTCAICDGRTSDQPLCHLYVGSIREAVRWATGMEYSVHETQCIAKGDPYCCFEIGNPK